MLIGTILVIAIGVLAGTFTGLAPGIHINLVAFLLVAYQDSLPLTTIQKILFIVAMAITHTFLDAIPSIYLGAPDSDTVLNVLPGHKMLMQGKGYEALKLTVIGSLFSLLIIIALSPVFILVVPIVYPFLNENMAYFLIAIVIFSLAKVKDARSRLWSLIVFVLSGCLGLIVFSLVNLEQPMLPLLSGLFGVSGIVLALKENSKIPEQKIYGVTELSGRKIAKSSIIATFSGSLTGLFPGLGAAQAAMIGLQFLGNVGIKSLLVMLGGINTANFVFSLIALFTIEKARNGAIIAVMKLKPTIDFMDFFAIISCALLTAVLASLLCLYLGRKISDWITYFNYTYLNICVLSILLLITFYFTSYIGVVVLVISTLIGLIAPMKGVAKSNAMGCLLIPAIIYFLFH